ncbi:MAG: anti-sigma factor [Sphingomicrobium sp.]
MTTDQAKTEDTAAAELALGVLDGDERAAALRRVIAEPGFAREVEQWRNHFGLLFAGVAETAAPEGVLARVEAQLGGVREVAAIRPRNVWKPAALAASVAALAMTAVAFRPVPVAPVAPVVVAAAPMIAAMAAADGSEGHPALYDATAEMVKMPGPMPIPAGRSAQLWAIDGDQPPRPLGVFRETSPGIYVADAKMGAVIAPGMKLAISIEPIGGSPTGLPTGPVIASGLLTKV